MKRYLIAALALALVTASVVHAQTRFISIQDFKPDRIAIHQKVDSAKMHRCRGHAAPFKYAAWKVPVRLRAPTLSFWHKRYRITRAMSSRCLSSTTAIIRYVFPNATEDAALSVAYCESRLSATAYNPSGAAGLFQLMPIWYAGKFDPFDALANTRAAYGLSSGGYNWTPWVCQP